MACGLLIEAEWEGIGRRFRTRDVEGDVTHEDVVVLDVKLLPVLEDAALRGMLREALRAAGWADDGDGGLVHDADGVQARLDAAGGTVTLRASAAARVKARGSAVSDGTKEEAEAAAEAAAAKELEAVKARAKEGLAAKTVAELVRAEPGVRATLQVALNRVYREALEVRARALGEVESVQERGDAQGSYEVTITVKA